MQKETPGVEWSDKTVGKITWEENGLGICQRSSGNHSGRSDFTEDYKRKTKKMQSWID
jgi:hypothetical protein